MAPNAARSYFFLLIQTLPTFWAERIWILRIFIFFHFLDPNFWISRSQISGFPGPKNLDFPTSKNLDFPASKKSTRRPGGGRDFQVSRFPNSQIPGPQISKFPDSQNSRFPGFQTPPPAPPPDEFSDPNLTPLPTHPGIKYVARALAATYWPTKEK